MVGNFHRMHLSWETEVINRNYFSQRGDSGYSELTEQQKLEIMKSGVEPQLEGLKR